MIGAHFALDRADRALGVRDGLALCQLADESLAGFRECDDGRRGSRAFRVRDNGGGLTLHNGNDGIRRAEVNADYFSHVLCSLLSEQRGPAITGLPDSSLAAYRYSRSDIPRCIATPDVYDTTGRGLCSSPL